MSKRNVLITTSCLLLAFLVVFVLALCTSAEDRAFFMFGAHESKFENAWRVLSQERVRLSKGKIIAVNDEVFSDFQNRTSLVDELSPEAFESIKEMQRIGVGCIAIYNGEGYFFTAGSRSYETAILYLDPKYPSDKSSLKHLSGNWYVSDGPPIDLP